MNVKKNTNSSNSKVSLPVMKGTETCNVPVKEAYFKQELIDRIRAHVEMMSKPIARRGVYYNRPPSDITMLQEKLSSRSHDCHYPPKTIKEETLPQKENKDKLGHIQSYICPLKSIKEGKMPQKEKKTVHTRKLKRMKLKTKPCKPNLTDNVKGGDRINRKNVSGDDSSDSYEANFSQSVMNFEKQRQQLLIDLSQLQKELANLKIPKCLINNTNQRIKVTDNNPHTHNVNALKKSSLLLDNANHQPTNKPLAPPPTRGIPPRPGTPFQLNRIYDARTLFGSDTDRLFGKPNVMKDII